MSLTQHLTELRQQSNEDIMCIVCKAPTQGSPSYLTDEGWMCGSCIEDLFIEQPNSCLTVTGVALCTQQHN